MFVSLDKAKERYAICKSCSDFKSVTKICNICHCFMPAKTTLSVAHCPVFKWDKEQSGTSSKDYTLDE